MSYTIWPRECDRVSRQTAAERDQLQDTLRRVGPALTEATGGARASAPVTAELDQFTAAHDGTTGEILARIEATLANGALAVAAYVHGDAEMAAEYGRASAVFTGPVVPPPPPDPAAPLPPEIVAGG